MATARIAVSSVLDTVTNTARSVSDIVNAASGSVSMLNDFVDTAKKKQQMYNKATIKALPQRIKEDIARENVERRIEIKNWIGSDESIAGMYAESLRELDDLFADLEAA